MHESRAVPVEHQQLAVATTVEACGFSRANPSVRKMGFKPRWLDSGMIARGLKSAQKK
jgi:hypothetical protein